MRSVRPLGHVGATHTLTPPPSQADEWRKWRLLLASRLGSGAQEHTKVQRVSVRRSAAAWRLGGRSGRPLAARKFNLDCPRLFRFAEVSDWQSFTFGEFRNSRLGAADCQWRAPPASSSRLIAELTPLASWVVGARLASQQGGKAARMAIDWRDCGGRGSELFFGKTFAQIGAHKQLSGRRLSSGRPINHRRRQGGSAASWPAVLLITC